MSEKNYDGQTNFGDCWTMEVGEGRRGKHRTSLVLIGQHCLEAERYLQVADLMTLGFRIRK